VVLVDQPLKPLLKRWFRELSPLKGSTPETKRGKGLELLEMSIVTDENHSSASQRNFFDSRKILIE
uniref:hypothetical protein n=1 Tax=Microcoleus sp. CAWBG640 TaxID=2841653 RepID=UPI00312B4DC0